MAKKNNPTSKNSFDKEWGKRVMSALDTMDNAAKQQLYDATHTADGKELKIGLEVYLLNDPETQWSISEIEKQTYKRKITLESKGEEPVRRTPYKLFVSQKKAVDACIKDIQQSEQIILRDLRESMSRLDANARIKKMKMLKQKLKRG